MRCVLLGPPGAGKGTVGHKLAHDWSVPEIATGDLLREEVEAGTELGKLVHGYMECGELVPDNLIFHLLKHRLAEADAGEGFILDGFPRTVAQAEALLELLAERDERLDCVVYLEAADEVVVQRLSGRRLCGSCGAIYHVDNHPPQQDGQCDRCGGRLIQRDDDRPETVRRRLRVYHRQTEPVIQFFEQRDLLQRVAGEQSPTEVVQATRQAVQSS